MKPPTKSPANPLVPLPTLMRGHRPIVMSRSMKLTEPSVSYPTKKQQRLKVKRQNHRFQRGWALQRTQKTQRLKFTQPLGSSLDQVHCSRRQNCSPMQYDFTRQSMTLMCRLNGAQPMDSGRKIRRVESIPGRRRIDNRWMSPR